MRTGRAKCRRERTTNFPFFGARGPSTGTGRFQQAMEARETYRTILREVEPLELARLARRPQYVVDSGDPMSLLIADSILRENFTRPKDRRPFVNAALASPWGLQSNTLGCRVISRVSRYRALSERARLYRIGARGGRGARHG
jgi:hypothetical protein